MAPPAIIETPFLILRCTGYSESSVIAAGLTPHHGQIHFLVRGGKKLGAKRFPMIDLFRLVHVSYRDTGRELLHPGKMEPAEFFGDVARHVTAYRTAGWLAQFALANVPAGLEHPRLFHAMRLGLSRLAALHRQPQHANVQADAILVGICLTYLHEAGWLAEQTASPRETEQCLVLLAMAAGEGPAPLLKAENWTQLKDWVLACLRAVECRVPPLP